MHPALKTSLLFLAFLFCGDRGLATISGALVSMSHDRYVEVYTKRNPVDVLILGNSRADNHFSEVEIRNRLGLTAVNLAQGGLSPVLMEALLQDFVEHHGPPKLILFEASGMINDPALIGDLRLLSPYSSRIAELVRRVAPPLHYTAQVFHVFSYNNEMFLRTLRAIPHRQEERILRGTPSPGLIAAIAQRTPYPLINFPDNEAALTRMLPWASERGIPFRVVVTPFLPIQRAKILNYPAWCQRLFNLGVREAQFWDYSQRMSDTRSFHDGLHLNRVGVIQFLEVAAEDGLFQLAGPVPSHP